MPLLSVTATLQNGTSNDSVKVKMSVWGALDTVLPTGGFDFTKKAWANAGEIPRRVTSRGAAIQRVKLSFIIGSIFQISGLPSVFSPTRLMSRFDRLGIAGSERPAY
jgi:hypothetical protein